PTLENSQEMHVRRASLQRALVNVQVLKRSLSELAARGSDQFVDPRHLLPVLAR
ncbi:hypothetical protein A2U01_0113081, partial [Trifolium medium]|nr:hypothetical protein [Trifolium medium]